MFGTRTVTAATWTNGKRTITGCWEYSGVFDKFDVWLDQTDPATGERLHVIVDGASPEWGSWKLVKPKQNSVDKPSDSDTTGA